MRAQGRAQVSFWTLTAVVILAVGLTARALAAPAGPGSDIVLVASLLLLAASAFLLTRVMRALLRTGTPTRAQPGGQTQPSPRTARSSRRRSRRQDHAARG